MIIPDAHGPPSVAWLIEHWERLAEKSPEALRIAKFAEALLEIAACSIELAPIADEMAAAEAAAVVRDLKPLALRPPAAPVQSPDESERSA